MPVDTCSWSVDSWSGLWTPGVFYGHLQRYFGYLQMDSGYLEMLFADPRLIYSSWQMPSFLFFTNLRKMLKNRRKCKKSPNSAKIPRGQLRKCVQCIPRTRKPYGSHQNFDSRCHRKKVSLTTYEVWRPSWILGPTGRCHKKVHGDHLILLSNCVPDDMQQVWQSREGGAWGPPVGARLHAEHSDRSQKPNF